MALYGHCFDCGATAWLNEDGSCVAGHPRERVAGIIDDTASETSGRFSAATKGLGRAITDLKKPKTREEIEAREARNEYEAIVKSAQEALAVQAAPVDKELASARASLASAQAFGMQRIGSFGGMALCENSLATPNGVINLETDSVRATVDATGSVYAEQKGGLGRAVVGGALLGPVGAIVGSTTRKSKTHDMRELYLCVESSMVSAVVACDPNKGPEARQFAAQVNMMGAGAAVRAQQRAELTPQWQRHVDDMVIKRAAILANPRKALAEAQGNTVRVDAAQAALPAKA